MTTSEDMRNGKIRVNSTRLFFPLVIKGLIGELNRSIYIRNKAIPHRIFNTGDDTMWLFLRGQDFSIEPTQVSNEGYQYNTLPYCELTVGSLDTVPDQLTSPYANGLLEYEDPEGAVTTFQTEFRRFPIRIGIDLKYHLESFTDCLEAAQSVIAELAYIRTFKIVYMGQVIQCSYRIPEAFAQEHLMDMDGTTTESKDRTISLSLEVETSFPVYEPRTIMDMDHPITSHQHNIYTKPSLNGTL